VNAGANVLGRHYLGPVARLEKADGTAEQLLLPKLNLVRMHVEKRAELLYRLLSLHRRLRHLGLELGAKAPLSAGHDSLLEPTTPNND
jgi:hypothetical protein